MSEEADRLFVKLPVTDWLSQRSMWKCHDWISQNRRWKFHNSSLVIWWEEIHPAAMPVTSTKPTSQSPCSNLQSPSTNLEKKESMSTGASKDKSSILCLTCAMKCYKLLFVNDSCICLSHSAQQSTVGPDSFPWLPDGTWVDGCIFRLDTSQHRSFFFLPILTCQKPWDLFMPLLALAVHRFWLS